MFDDLCPLDDLDEHQAEPATVARKKPAPRRGDDQLLGLDLLRGSQTQVQQELMPDNLAWRAMCAEQEVATAHLDDYDIVWLKSKLTRPGQSAKTPLLVAMIKTLDLDTDPDLGCQLMDMKATIPGMIHRDVVNLYGSHLSVGSVLVLKSVTGVMTLKKKCCVTITLNNVVALYAVDASGCDVFVDHRHTLTKQDVMRCLSSFNQEEALKRRKAASAALIHSPAAPSPVAGLSSLIQPQSNSRSQVSLTQEDVQSLFAGLNEDDLFGEF